ncbi:MAG: hypothetical protein WC238_05110 [Parcubacteria group bacterium]|jgi:hypothetical protein
MNKIKTKIFLLALIIFAASVAQAKALSCQSAYQCGNIQFNSCVNGTCQKAACGDGFCNACSFSPCGGFIETKQTCSKDCGQPTTPPPTIANKSDSDNGQNYFLKGTTSGLLNSATATKTDTCLSKCSGDNAQASGQCLLEYYLSGDQLKSQKVACAGGCENGACKQTCAVAR